MIKLVAPEIKISHAVFQQSYRSSEEVEIVLTVGLAVSSDNLIDARSPNDFFGRESNFFNFDRQFASRHHEILSAIGLTLFRPGEK